MHRVAILTYDNAALFELGCAVELFGLPRPEFNHWYTSEVVSFSGGPHQVTGGICVSSKRVQSLEGYDTLVVPSWPTNSDKIDAQLSRQVLNFSQSGKRMLSFCSGAFLLAQLGLLDNRDATTHWRYATQFKTQFPKVNYVDDVLYVIHDNIGCSAGSAAAIDLGLAIIRQDYGYQVSSQVARRMVISSHRKGGQSQFVDTPVERKESPFNDTLDWVRKNLHKKLIINDLADLSHMSRRTFDRKFRHTFQMSAKEWITSMRLDLARRLLEKENHSIEVIAGQSGFDNATSMRHHFRKSLGISPRQYRDQFGSLTNHHK